VGVLQGCCNVLHKYGPERVLEGPTGVSGTIDKLRAKALQIGHLSGPKTEGEGFEPSVDRKAHNGFRDRPVQPLRHPSGAFDCRRHPPAGGRR
jgi:hypothetical protein